MYTITKEKQFIYLIDEAKNKKYSLNINLKEIKNENTGRILKNFPDFCWGNFDTISRQLYFPVIRTIVDYKENTADMFLLLEFWEKITSIYTSLKRDINFEITLPELEIIKAINNNFSEFAKILKNDNYPKNILQSIKNYQYYLSWKNYKDLISFENFCNLCYKLNSFNEIKIEIGRFIIKVLNRSNFFPLLKINCTLLRFYCYSLENYYNQCLFLNKTPNCENNMLREINETSRTYLYFKKEFDKEKFKANYKKHSKAWKFIYGDFIVTIPIEPKDLVIEGEKMHHCVGSYVDKVSNNETYIAFIRKKRRY